MKKLLIILTVVFFSNQITFWNSWDIQTWSWENTTIEIQNSIIESNEILDSEKEEDTDLLMESLNIRKESIKKIIEQNPIESIIDENELKKTEARIQKEIYESMNQKINEEIEKIKEAISSNNEIAKSFKETEEENQEIKDKLKTLEENNKVLLWQLKEKEDLLEANSKTIKEYEQLESKFEILIKQNTELLRLQEEKNSEILKKKLYILYFWIFIYILILTSVYFFEKHKSKLKKVSISAKMFSNVNVFSTIWFIFFLFWFIFYAFPEMIWLLILSSVWLFIVNWFLISSFLWSWIVLARLNVWDTIRYESWWALHEWRIKQVNVIWLFIEQVWEYWNDLWIEDFVIHRHALIWKIQKIPRRMTKQVQAWIVINNTLVSKSVEIIEHIEKKLNGFIIKQDNERYLWYLHTFTDSSNLRIDFKLELKRDKEKELNELIVRSYHTVLNEVNTSNDKDTEEED